MTTPDIAAITYFDSLPRVTLPALQAAWDKARTGKFNKGSIYKVMCKDFAEIGEELPTAELFNVWIANIERGEIERPERKTSGGDRTALLKKAKAAHDSRQTAIAPVEPEPVQETLPEAAITELSAPLASASRPFIVDGSVLRVSESGQDTALVALRAASDRLVSELVVQLQAGIEQTARESAARMLREIADDLEAAA